MSETDSFIDEVTEEVRRDRLFAAFRKYGWIGGVAIAVIVGGAAWSEWSKAKARAEAQAFGDAVLASSQAADPLAALTALPETVTLRGGQAGLAALMAGAQAAQSGKIDEALAQYRTAAADTALPASLRDLARLKAVITAGSSMDAAARDAELAALAQPGAPYRLMAVEQQALAKLAAGDRDGAMATAREILADAEATPGLQQRASELIVALGGDPAQQ